MNLSDPVVMKLQNMVGAISHFITFKNIYDIKNEISFYNPIDNSNGNKKVGLIRTYIVHSFYNIENDEKIIYISWK